MNICDDFRLNSKKYCMIAQRVIIYAIFFNNYHKIKYHINIVFTPYEEYGKL